MAEENISQEFRLKNIYETKNYLIEEINRNELMNKKHKKVCRTLNYIILASTITSYNYKNGCVSTSSFASLVGMPIGIASFSIGLKIYAISKKTKKYKSIIKKKKKSMIKCIVSQI